VVRWDKEAVPFQRGAWVRLYGIPIHAWSEDFARVLISTPSLEIISRVDKLLIDGQMVDIKIVEECGVNIGEDACLFEDEDEQKSQSDNEEVFCDPETCKNIDIVVDKIVKELEVEDLNTVAESREVVGAGVDIVDAIPEAMSDVGSKATLDNGEAATTQSTAMPEVVRTTSGVEDVANLDGEMLQDGRVLKLVNQAEEDDKGDDGQGKKPALQLVGKQHVSTVSGPPFKGKSVMSGPWST
jgi:hypothetical protein